MPKLTGIKETCLTVSDLDRSERFYRELLNLEKISDDERLRAFSVAGSHVLILFQQGGTTQPVQLPGGLIPAHGASGQSHLAFSIPAEDLEAWKQHLPQHGVTVESVATWPRGGTSIYFRDPDGHLLELVTPGIWSIY